MMSCPVGASAEHVAGSTLQEPVEDRLGQIRIMGHLSECRQGVLVVTIVERCFRCL